MPAIDHELVCETRDELGLRTSQILEQLNAELDLGRKSLDNILCGNRNPSMRVVRALGRILGLPVSRIVLNEGEQPVTPAKPERPKDPSGPARRQDTEEKKTAPRRVQGSAVAS